MKLARLGVQNVRSFGEKRTIHFHDDFTILIGPNAGGKSNLLDIITVGVRKFFLRPWGLIRHEDATGPYYNFTSEDPFANLSDELPKFDGASGPLIIEFDWVINEQDITNLTSVANGLDRLRENAKRIRGGEEAIDWFKRLDPSEFTAGETLQYKVEGGEIQSLSGTKGDHFREFLQQFHKLSYVDEEDAKLTTPFVHFPPYRGIGAQRLRMSLASQTRWNFELGYARATSRQTMSLIELATFHFASKMRGFESEARIKGFEEFFRKDPEVQQVARALQKLGYEWDLVLKDELTNTYEIVLKKDDQTFDLTSASSGEKEIINFVFGTFALNVRNGLVVVDEPELHLHPKWQRMLYGVFEDLHRATGNQFVLATHSPAFITADTLGKLKRVARIDRQSSIIPLDATLVGKRRELLQMINSHNNEKLFFADKVVLVEGIQDRLVFETIINDLLRESSGTAAATTEIVEVLEVYGKSNLQKYRELLESIQVASFIIADRDYADQTGTAEVKALFVDDLVKVTKNTLANPKSEDRAAMTVELHRAVASKDWSNVAKLWQYIVNRHRSLKHNLSAQENQTFKAFLGEKRKERTYILRAGAIEHYLPNEWTSLDRTIELISSSDFDARMREKVKEYRELKAICKSIIHT
jgi:putative ATP-dependent endonuclease of the OLD family